MIYFDTCIVLKGVRSGNQQDALSGNHERQQNLVPTQLADADIFYKISGNFDLLVVLQQTSGDH